MKSAVFGSSSDSSLPPLIGVGGGLVCESVEKTDLLSAHFDGKQSRDPVDQPSTCHPSPSLTTFAFRSREVKLLLLDLDSYGGIDPLGMFPLVLKKTAVVVASRIAVVFRRNLRLGSFPVCWCVPNVQMVHLPPQHPIIDQFLQHLYFQRFLNVWCRFVLGGPMPSRLKFALQDLCPVD